MPFGEPHYHVRVGARASAHAGSRLHVCWLTVITCPFVRGGSEGDQISQALRRRGGGLLAPTVTSASFCTTLSSDEEIQTTFAAAVSAPGRPAAADLSSPPPPSAFNQPRFVLIEYLLAYLFLITDSRQSGPRVRACGSCTPTQLNPSSSPPPKRSPLGRPWVWKCQSASKYRADRLLVGQSDGFSD